MLVEIPPKYSVSELHVAVLPSGQHLLNFRLHLSYGVAAGAGAELGLVTADQAGAVLRAGEFAPLAVQHINVKQTAKGMCFLNVLHCVCSIHNGHIRPQH